MCLVPLDLVFYDLHTLSLKLPVDFFKLGYPQDYQSLVRGLLINQLTPF